MSDASSLNQLEGIDLCEGQITVLLTDQPLTLTNPTWLLDFATMTADGNVDSISQKV